MKRFLAVLSLSLVSFLVHANPPAPPGSGNAAPIDDFTLVLLVIGLFIGAFQIGREAAKRGYRL